MEIAELKLRLKLTDSILSEARVGGIGLRSCLGSSPGVYTSDNQEEMIQQLVHALATSPNEAADDVLLEALRLGNEQEQSNVLAALLKR